MEPTIVGGDPPLRRSKLARARPARVDCDSRRDVRVPSSPVRSIDDDSLRKAFDCKFLSTSVEDLPAQYAPSPVNKDQMRNADEDNSSTDDDDDLERLKEMNLSIDEMMKVFRGEDVRHHSSPVQQYNVPRDSPWSTALQGQKSTQARYSNQPIWPPLPPEPDTYVPPSTLWRDIALRAEAREVASLYGDMLGKHYSC